MRTIDGTTAFDKTPEEDRNPEWRPTRSNAIVVASQHPETIGVRMQIRIERLAPRPSVPPVRVKSFELVAKLNLARLRETEGRVVELDIPVSGCNCTVCVAATAVHRHHAFDVNSRWSQVFVSSCGSITATPSEVLNQNLPSLARTAGDCQWRSGLPLRPSPSSRSCKPRGATDHRSAVEFGPADGRNSGAVTEPQPADAVCENP